MTSTLLCDLTLGPHSGRQRCAHPHEHRELIGRGGRLTRPLLVAALAAGLVVAGSSAAQAQSITDADAAGDMVKFDCETEGARSAPNQVRNDVLRTTLTHSATRISIRVKYAELRRRWPRPCAVRADGHQRGSSSGTLRVRGTGRLGRQRTCGEGGTRGQVRCAIRHSIDYTRNVVAVSFPRQCASSPRWVKFRVGAYRYGETVVYVDDALRDEPWFMHRPPAQSPRVYRAS